MPAPAIFLMLFTINIVKKYINIYMNITSPLRIVMLYFSYKPIMQHYLNKSMQVFTITTV